MPGFELFGAEEKKEVNDVLETGILMRYGFDGPRKGIWKSKELEAAVCSTFGAQYAQLTSSGTAAFVYFCCKFRSHLKHGCHPCFGGY
jgi:8-amino-3,8-dideoxy-alpha-D-manno-octulosonate transaminase